MSDLATLLPRFFIFRDGAPTLLLTGQYSVWLVLLSVVVASLTSALAMQVAGVARGTRGLHRQLVVLTGALALAGGIWSMHFIGMLAFQLCTWVSFHAGITAASAVPAFLASWVALDLISRGQLSTRSWVLGGILVGAGIGTMHYAGMAAMEMSAQLRYDPLWFGASIVVAVLLAMLALWIRFGLAHRWRPVWVISLGGLVMGCAVAGMHYTAMAAARFIGVGDGPCNTGLEDNGLLALAITVATLTISGTTAGANGLMALRRLNHQLLAERQRQDITDQALRESETKYRTLIANSPGVSFRCELQAPWRMILISDAVETLTGWPAPDFIGGQLHVGDLIHRHDRRRVEQTVEEALALGQPYTVEYRLHTRDGGERWVSERGRFIAGERGRMQWIDGVMLDITERMRLHLQLEEAKHRAESAADAKSAFLANMSHEIRTPMNAILGFTELLLDTTLTESQRRHLSTVRSSARSLLGLLNDILDTAKLDKGAMTLEDADFSLRRVCEQAIASLGLLAQRKGLRLHLDYPRSQPELFRGDALRVQQVLLNLVGNAIKFTERGDVTLRMRHEQGRIHLSIIDTGIGIAADRLDRIFEAFAQADASTTRRFGGTGLGTTISRQLVECMGGRITVDSVEGEGSVFHVYLPLPAGQALVNEPGEASTASPLPPLRLLVADDVPQNSELLQLILTRQGHEVRTVADGMAAVKALTDERFDLVLMDVHMPVLDGLGATRRVRNFEQANGRPRTPIVALTASVLEEDRQAALAAGMDGFAVKPVEPARLIAEMARVMGITPGQPLRDEPAPSMASTLAARHGAPTQPMGLEVTDLDWPHGLHLWGNATAWHRGLRRFAQDQRDGVSRLHQLMRQRDWTALRELVHRWRGAAGSLALPVLLDAATAFEEALADDDQEEFAAGADAVCTALDQALRAIDRLEDDSQPQAHAPSMSTADPKVALAADSLALALRGSQLDDEALQVLCDAWGLQRCEALIRAIGDFDFDQALRALQGLRQQLVPAGSSSGGGSLRSQASATP
ncbi:MHYT domain-containing protein [Roseateles depolymerans]|uniref:Sensory/regulatory protein RpfC n=1 Tax=Roseateles depolymerans TaxID=76731 RepID=A0A0U3N418_9BURK|nr:MHYT domain-containing protein [Roseateles depolymerans]ALV08948.1 Two component response regulator sensor histidine kinase/response regulator subunits [Roseateles depolymerans]REG09390.1 PAS domain S-box-containing protein [Roseateles depolymerans]